MDRCMWFPYALSSTERKNNPPNPKMLSTFSLIIVSSKRNERDVKYKIGSYLKEDLCFFFLLLSFPSSFSCLFILYYVVDDYGNILCIVYIMDL